MRSVSAALAALVLLAACSPEYNWREIRSPEHGYAVMLPARPAAMTRAVRLGEFEVSMQMRGARAGGAAFTVASALLPEDSASAREHALASMRSAMVRNIEGIERGGSDASVDLVDANGRRRERVAARRIEAAGKMRGEEVTMLAGFAARGARVYQWVVLGASPDRDQARTFLDSFRLVEPAP